MVREVKEESGYDVKARKLLALLDRNLHGHPPIPYHAYKLFFLCDIVGGNAHAEQETDAVGFFAHNEIPPLSLTRVTPAQIARVFEHLFHPEWPTQFDGQQRPGLLPLLHRNPVHLELEGVAFPNWRASYVASG